MPHTTWTITGPHFLYKCLLRHATDTDSDRPPLYIDSDHLFCTPLRIDDFEEDFKKVHKLPLCLRGELDNMTRPDKLEVWLHDILKHFLIVVTPTLGTWEHDPEDCTNLASMDIVGIDDLYGFIRNLMIENAGLVSCLSRITAQNLLRTSAKLMWKPLGPSESTTSTRIDYRYMHHLWWTIKLSSPPRWRQNWVT